jgi:hypothetical protein
MRQKAVRWSGADAVSYLKHLQMQRQLEEQAKEERETRELSEKELKAAEETIGEAKRIDANTADVEAILEEARASLSSKDYKTALEKAREGRERAERVYRERVKAIVDSSGTMVELARSVGESPGGATYHEGAMDALKKGEMDRAVELAKKSWKATEKGLYEHLSNAFSQAQALILTAKNSGKDVSVPEDLLSRARTALEENDYESAMGFTRDCLENVSSGLRDDVSESLESAESLLSLATELDGEVEKPQSILQRAREELDALEFDKAMNSTKQAVSALNRILQSGLEDGLAAFRRELEEAGELGADTTDVLARLKEAEEKGKEEDYHGAVDILRKAYEDIRRAKFQVVLDTIAQSKDKFQTALKIGADIRKAMDLLNQAREALNAGRFREALENASASDAEVDRLVKEFHEVEERIKTLQERFAFAEKVGVDTTKPRSLLENARLALQAKEFGKVLDFIHECEDATDRAEYEFTMQSVEAAEQAITLGERMNLDMAAENGLLEEAIVATKGKDYETAIGLAKKTRAEAVRRLEGQIRATISEFRESIPVAGKQAVKVRKLFDKAESAFAAEDYEKAWRFASDGASLLEGIVRERTSEFVQSIDIAVKLGTDLGVEIPDLEDARTEAEKLFEGSTLEEMIQVTVKHSDRVGATVDILFDELKSKVVEARNLKLDTEGMVTSLKDAKIARGTDDHLGSLRKLMEVAEDVQEALDAYHRAYNSMSSTAAMIAEAKKKGVDVSQVLQTLVKAKKLFEAGDLEQAYSVAEEAKEDTEGIMALYSAAQNITEARNSLEIAEKYGFNVEALKEDLQSAKAAMKERNYQDAIERSAKVRADTTAFLEENVSRMVSGAEALLEEAVEKGFPVKAAQASVNAARENLEVGAFGEAAEAAQMAKAEIEQLRAFRNDAKAAVKEAQAALAEVESMNVEAPRSTAFLQRAEKAYEDHRYREAIQLGNRILEEVEVERKAYVTQTIARFEEAIAKARAEGINTQSAEKLIRQSKQHLTSGRYRESLELAMQSENEVERVSLQQDMAAKALETARKKIESFAAPVPAAQELMAQAQETFDEGDYVKALELAIKTGDEFQRLADAWDEAREAVESAEELSAVAEQLGVEAPEAAELLAAIRKSLDEGDSEVAKAKAPMAAEMLTDAIRKMMEAAIREAKDLKALCDELVVEVPEFGRSVAEAAALMDEGDFLRARELTESAKAKADECLSKYAAEVFANSKAAVAHAKKMGADVSESVRILKESRTAMRAKDYRQGIALAQKSVEVVESTRKLEKRYIDLTYQADLSISSAKKFGIDVEAAERRLLEAIETQKSDLGVAITLAEDAVNLAKEAVEAFAPNVEAEITVEKPQVGEWRDATLTLRNLSKAVAKDVTVKIMGDAEVEDVLEVASIRGGGEHTLKFRIRMSAEGTVPLNIEVTSHRVMDGKEYVQQTLAEVPVGAVDEEVAIPEEEAEEDLVAREEAKCALCMGSIKVGMEMVRHSCGTMFHKPCGGRVEECPTCGRAMQG